MSVIKDSLKGPNGGVSSTRINVYALLAVFIITCLAGLFFNKSLPEAVLDYLIVLILGFAGFKTVDNGVKANKDIQVAKAEAEGHKTEEVK